jgi:ferredoxin/flavodoxin---NADP+ reductase
VAETCNAVVAQRLDIAPALVILRVRPDGWELPAFIPGQYGVLGLPGSAPRCAGADTESPPLDPDKIIKRAYSIASSSVAREYAEFYVTLVHSGALTPRLFALGEGDRVFLSPRIVGMFTIDKAPEDRHVVLVATGTGLAPYVSMLRSRLEKGGPRRFSVLLGARHTWDLGYHGELMALEHDCPNFHYVATISRPGEEPEPWTGRVGYVQDLWTAGEVGRKWGFRPGPDNAHVFLCGNPKMIETMLEVLQADGFREHSRKEPAGQVHTEKYW